MNNTLDGTHLLDCPNCGTKMWLKKMTAGDAVDCGSSYWYCPKCKEAK